VNRGCSIHGIIQKYITEFYLGSPKGRDDFGDLGGVGNVLPRVSD
jgi:hypothetical protein